MTDAWELMANWPGGTVASLATAETSDGMRLLFAATPLGLFGSQDLGETWFGVEAPFSSPSVEVIAASPAFTEDQMLAAAAFSELYVSDDGGGSWRPRLRGSRMTSLAFSPGFATDRILFAGTETDGVLRSDDAGRKWTSVNPGLLELSVYAIALSPNFPDDHTGFVATNAAIYRTRNRGQSWRELETGLAETTAQCLAISPSFANDRLVLAGTEGDGLLLSSDGGTHWRAPDELTGQSVAAVAFASTSGGERIIVASTESGLFSSRDQGGSWRRIDADTGFVLSLITIPAQPVDTLIAGRFRDGAARSVDAGDTWEPANNGLNANLLADLILSPRFDEDDTLYAVDLEAGVFASFDEGATWVERNDGLGETRVLGLSAAAGRDAVYAAAIDGVYRSDDSANTWERKLVSEEPVLALEALPANGEGAATIFAASAQGRIHSSVDGGESWREIATLGIAADSISIAASPDFDQDGAVFLSLSFLGGETNERRAAIWGSTDRGETWRQLLSQPGDNVAPLAVSPNFATDRTVFAGIGNQILSIIVGDRTTDEDAPDARWSVLPLGGRASAITDLLATTSPEMNQCRVYAASNSGIFRWRSGEEQYEQWGEDAGRKPVVSLAAGEDRTGRMTIYAGGLGGVIWRRYEGDFSDLT